MLTTYGAEWRDQLVASFIKSFNADSRPFAAKLKSAHLSKGTYSYLLNNKGTPSKRTIEAMRAWLEGRPPKWTLVKEGEAYCGSCESIKPLETMKDAFTCRKCTNSINSASKKRTGSYGRYQAIRYMKLKEQGPLRVRYLEQRRAHYLKRTYGKLARCVELVRAIKKELGEGAYEQEN